MTGNVDKPRGTLEPFVVSTHRESVMHEHLIVVVPGIGGSVLAPPDRPDQPVWSLSSHDLCILRHPERLSIAEVPTLNPIGLIKSLKPIPFWTAIDGYEQLLRMLGAPHPTVLAAPYDFRQGIRHASEHLDSLVRERLELLWSGGQHTRKVIVVAHSLGGLVARYWIGPCGGYNLCKALITLGTPHLGAPKALDILANGITLRGVPVLTRLRDVLRQWPSMAELLPRYQSILDTRPAHAGGTGRLLYPYELNLDWGVDASAAYQIHKEIEQVWEKLPRSETTMVPRIGYGHGTLRSCAWDGKSVTVSKSSPTWPALGASEADLGDGTVPAYCGLPIEMNQPPDDFLVNSRHGQLGVLDEVKTIVTQFERSRGNFRPIRGNERPVVLGLDLDEIQAAGEPFEIAASVRGIFIDPATPVWATAWVNAGDLPFVEVRLEWDASAHVFRGNFPGLSPGSYLIRVAARAVPGAGDLESEETVEVLDDADLV